MRRSSFRLVAAAAAIALAVTGCSSSSDEAANEDTELKSLPGGHLVAKLLAYKE